jgi:DNA-binding PadR family transcriptional regulator
MARDAQRDSARLVVLSLLAEGPRYGYLITKESAARSGDRLRLTPGVLYPLLKELEADGLVVSSWEEVRAEGSPDDQQGRRRKWYRLSPKGRKHLAITVDAHRLYRRIIDAFIGGDGERETRGEAAP